MSAAIFRKMTVKKALNLLRPSAYKQTNLKFDHLLLLNLILDLDHHLGEKGSSSSHHNPNHKHVIIVFTSVLMNRIGYHSNKNNNSKDFI